MNVVGPIEKFQIEIHALQKEMKKGCTPITQQTAILAQSLFELLGKDDDIINQCGFERKQLNKLAKDVLKNSPYATWRAFRLSQSPGVKRSEKGVYLLNTPPFPIA